MTEPRTAGGGPSPEQARDERLVQRALSGDLDAFNELVTHYQDFLFALVVRMVGDRDAAADVVQEAFLNAYRNLRSYRGGAVRSWLARIALNAATDVLRRRRRRPAEPYPDWEDDAWQPPTGPEVDPEQVATRRARGRVLTDALQRIGEDQRRAIVLFDVEGFDYAEIAAITGVSLGTVKSRIHRGRLALRELLQDQMELFRE
ncbi:MAG TPA: sigma-70 family RNA polymerase sigma factor [Candidatus Dormibacteraeota bacterium]|nr:sigma-70 family RNA polymerase sigma factor [Candidatus Dormibacteraeota bacterium]